MRIGRTLFFEVSLFLPVRRAVPECKKARPENQTSLFAHEAGYCLCGAWITAVKENSRRRKIGAQHP